ncbi:MAG: hypothetical protein FWF44_07545 [Defluviitaleaceae bacterium]|nr:hypothetical protein [Defluviitaleaceae bacterium]
MTARRRLFEDVLYNLGVYAVFAGAFFLLAAKLSDAQTAFAYMFLLAAPFFFNLFLRLKVRNAALFAAGHLVFPALAIFFAQPILVKLAVMLALVLMDIFSIASRVSKSVTKFTGALCVGGIAVLIALSFTAGAIGFGDESYLYPILAVVIFAAYILCAHMANVDKSLDAITTTSVQPVKEILSFNNKIMLAFTAILLVIAVAAPFLRLDKVISAAGHGLLAGLKFVLAKIFAGGNDQPAATAAPMATQTPDQGGGMDLASMYPSGAPWLGWVVLQNIFFVILWAGLAVLIPAGVIYGVYRYVRRFNKTRRDGDDEKEFILLDAPSKALAGRLRSAAPLIFRENRVRRAFRKTMRRYYKAGTQIERSDTPEQMKDKITSENLGKLVEEYEEVRYGREQ